MSGAIGDVLNFASNLKLGVWAWGLQPASWRGINFAVRNSNIRRGRRVVPHEYPYRDDVWVEDLGRGVRVVSFQGFLVGDDVFAQRDAMVAAAELPGIGELVHPSLGSIQATLTEFGAGERFELGRVVELEFSFIQGVDAPIFPTDIASALKTAVAVVQGSVAIVRSFTSALNLILVPLPAFTGFVNSVFDAGFGVVSTFQTFGAQVLAFPDALAGAVAGLPGNNGRYANAGVTTLQPATATVESALLASAAQRATASAAIATVGATTDPTLLPGNLLAMTEAIRLSSQSPGVQIRSMSNLAAFQPTISTPNPAPFGTATLTLETAMAALCRRSALISLANATTVYLPSSYQDALAVIQQVVGVFDAEILTTADSGDNIAYEGLRAMRTAIVADLVARGSQLPELITVSRGAPLPSLALAYSLYGDATRADDLTARVNPINPLFFPLVFQALAS